MGYATQAQVQTAAGGAARLRQISNRTNSAALTVDADAIAFIAENIADADAMIDSYAAKRYAVPMSPVPEVIQRTSAKLAYLYMARSTGMITQAETDALAEIVGKDGWLIRLSRGEVSLGVDPAPPAHSSVRDTAEQGSTDSLELSREKLAGFY